MQPAPAPAPVLAADEWKARAAAHEVRVDRWVAPHRERRRRGQPHPVLDFLFTYYSETPGRLRRWHPGPRVALAPAADGPAPHAGRRWYAVDEEGVVRLDTAAFLAERADTVRFVRRLLVATASRPAFTGCFGLHEWAMVYRDRATRHALPLRLGPEGTDAVVEAHPIRCSHIDAFRFFTPEAAPRNRLQPTRENQHELEQPGCLHAGMDLYKWAYKLAPATPGDLVADCFELAVDIRALDMRASPYDLADHGYPAVPIETLADCLDLAGDIRALDMRASPYDLAGHGYAAVAVETPEGKAEYVAAQRGFAQRGAALRQRLVELCDQLLGPAGASTAVPQAVRSEP